MESAWYCSCMMFIINVVGIENVTSSKNNCHFNFQYIFQSSKSTFFITSVPEQL